MEKVRYGLVGFGGIAEARIAKEGFGLDRARFAGNPAALAALRAGRRCLVEKPLATRGSRHLAEFLLGARITRVACLYTPPHMGLRVEEGAEIRFFTDKGTWGSARVSFGCARGGGEGTLLNLGFEIYGSTGVIRSYGTMFQLSGHPGEPVPIRLEVDRFSSRETVTIPSPANIYQLAIARHAESIRKGPPLGCEDGLHSLDLLLACHDSAKDGGRMQQIASPAAP